MAESKSLRIAYGEALAELGAENDKIVVLDADLSNATMTNRFSAVYPARFFDFGIAACYLILCFIYIFPFRNIKQTHLTLDGLLLHPPRKNILRHLPLCLAPASMNYIKHFSIGSYICPLLGRE